MFMWQFLSELTRISKEFQHLGTHKKNSKLNPNEQKLVADLIVMMNTIEKAYLQKDVTFIHKLYAIDKKFFESRREIFSKVKDPISAYHIVHIQRMLFLMQSPLIGMLIAENNSAIQ